MPRFGTDIAQGLGEGLSGLAEVQAGAFAGQAAREKIERDLSLARQRLDTEKGWLDLQREIAAKPSYHAPTKMDQDLSFLEMVGAFDRKTGVLTAEGKRYMGLTSAPTCKVQIIQHAGMVPYAVEECTDPATGELTVRKKEIPGAEKLPQTAGAGGGAPKEDAYQKWLTDFRKPVAEGGMGREPTEDEKKRKLVPGYTGEQKRVNEPLSGTAQATVFKIDSSVSIGRELLRRIDDWMMKDPRAKGAPTPDAAFKIFTDQEYLAKLKDSLKAKAAAASYFGGHVPTAYSEIITQSEQFVAQAIPQLTGSRAARYNELKARHIGNAPGGDPVYFLREKLQTALRNLYEERDDIIRAARTPVSSYVTSDELPPPEKIPHDGQTYNICSPGWVMSPDKQTCTDNSTGNMRPSIRVKWDHILGKVTQVL